MRVFSEQLRDHLATGLRACYLIFGDEPLQKIESLQLIRKFARDQGFTDVLRYSAHEEPLPWDDIFSASQSLSLFSSRQIIEIELADKFPKEFSDKIRELQQQLHPDLLLVLLGPKLQSVQQKSAWFTALEKQGVYIPVALPDAKFFPRWMKQRAQSVGVQIDAEGMTYLCHAFEGNLLAATQELEKLALQNLPQPITIAQLRQLITRQNAFDPFQWLDTLLEGKTQRGLRMLQQLRDEGVEPGMLHWALARELEILWALRAATDARAPLAPIFQQTKVWSSRQPLFQQALNRINRAQLTSMLAMMRELDSALRQFNLPLAWQWLQTLTLTFKGTNALRFVLPEQL